MVMDFRNSIASTTTIILDLEDTLVYKLLA
jgi:hypothetical protein